MDFLQVLLTRRSVRRFEGKEIPHKMVETLLSAAMHAPSAGNQQPWQFIVVAERSLLDTIPSFHPFSSAARSAPLAILVCGDLREVRHEGFWVQDCAAAVQNMLLAAHALDLGAVWLGIYPRQERVAGARKLFHLPEFIVPIAAVAVGFPAEVPRSVKRYKKARIRHNTWE